MRLTSDPNEFLRDVNDQNKNIWNPDPGKNLLRLLRLIIQICHWGAVSHPAAFFSTCIAPLCGAVGLVVWHDSTPIALLAFAGAAAAIAYGGFKAHPEARLLIALGYVAAIIYGVAAGFNVKSALLFIAAAFLVIAMTEQLRKARTQNDD